MRQDIDEAAAHHAEAVRHAPFLHGLSAAALRNLAASLPGDAHGQSAYLDQALTTLARGLLDGHLERDPDAAEAELNNPTHAPYPTPDLYTEYSQKIADKRRSPEVRAADGGVIPPRQGDDFLIDPDETLAGGGNDTLADGNTAKPSAGTEAATRVGTGDSSERSGRIDRSADRIIPRKTPLPTNPDIDAGQPLEDGEDEQLDDQGFNLGLIDLIRQAKSVTPETLPAFLERLRQWDLANRTRLAPNQDDPQGRRRDEYLREFNQFIVHLRIVAGQSANGGDLDLRTMRNSLEILRRLANENERPEFNRHANILAGGIFGAAAGRAAKNRADADRVYTPRLNKRLSDKDLDEIQNLRPPARPQPNGGPVFVPPKDWRAGQALRKEPWGKDYGFLDADGNIWIRPRGNIVGEPHWDVQMEAKWRRLYRGHSRSGTHLNVTQDGRIVHGKKPE